MSISRCSHARKWLCRSAGMLAAGLILAWSGFVTGKDAGEVAQPRIVDPGSPGGPPADAVVLFDGGDLSKWRSPRGGDKVGWTVNDGVLTIAPRSGDIVTREGFGDVQFHIEWATPPRDGRKNKGESLGNSGIKFHEAYEIQILDSYGGSSRPLGQAGAVYKQHVPLANACRAPGEWQSYDIVFRAPRFDEEGELRKHGRFTVFHNGVLIQDNVKIYGRTNSRKPVSPRYEQPLLLQAHGSKVRFRNIWIRRLAPRPGD